ncbi:MAG: DUF429 domain-containing protein [Acidimicrobiales bacterium]
MTAPVPGGPALAQAVLGVDAAGRHGWVGAVVDGSGLVGAHVAPALGDLIADVEATLGAPLAAVGVDIPIGVVDAGRRQADVAARAFVGARRSSVFWTPHRAALAAGSQAEANAVLRRLGVPGVSAQAWHLVPRIREVAVVAASDDRIVEVFPEASFRAMAGADLPHGKKVAAGALQRLALLAAAEPSIALPADPVALGAAGRVALDDLFGAAAAAWSAWRSGVRDGASALGDPAECDATSGRRIAVWGRAAAGRGQSVTRSPQRPWRERARPERRRARPGDRRWPASGSTTGWRWRGGGRAPRTWTCRHRPGRAGASGSEGRPPRQLATRWPSADLETGSVRRWPWRRGRGSSSGR